MGLVFLLVVLSSVQAHANQNEQSEECVRASSPTWTPQEAWVWKQLCLSRSADLNKARIFGGITRVDKPKTWSLQRVLRPRFIDTILTEAPYTEGLGNRRIVISGAWFQSSVLLEGSTLSTAIYLRDSRFDAPVNLLGAKIGGSIGFDGSAFSNTLGLERTRVAGSVFLRNASFEKVNLSGARVDGNVEIRRSTFQKTLDLNGAKVDGRVYLVDGSSFRDVNARNMTIACDVVASNSAFRQRLHLGAAKVGGDIYLNEGTFRDVNLARVKADGNVDATESMFRGDLDLLTAQVKGSVLLAESIFTKGVNCSGATVGGVLSLANNRKPATWHESAELNLTGSTVKGIEDTRNAWPTYMRLVGFVVQQPQGQTTAADDNFAEREVSWYIKDWLRREREFSRGSYMQLERMLRRVGRDQAANTIAMARIDYEYSVQATGTPGLFRRVLGVFHRAMSGYGYCPEWAMIWIVMLVAIGAIIARRIPQSTLDAEGVPSRIILSLQRLTPLIDFGRAYRDFDFTSDTIPNGVRDYFYLHAGLGYILFLILLGDVAAGV
jgi:hypothetical protein